HPSQRKSSRYAQRICKCNLTSQTVASPLWGRVRDGGRGYPARHVLSDPHLVLLPTRGRRAAGVGTRASIVASCLTVSLASCTVFAGSYPAYRFQITSPPRLATKASCAAISSA